MEVNRSRPAVSRETRLLLVTVLIALSALWVLARVRFPERPVTPNPVPPILTQLAPPPGFDDLAESVFALKSRVEPFLLTLRDPLAPPSGLDASSHLARAAVRVGTDVAIALTEGSGLPAEISERVTVLARDPVSGLTVLRTAASPTPPLTTWMPRRPQSPRYLVAAEATAGGISIHPVFVGDLRAVVSPTWLASLWAMPSQTDLMPGTFLFTMDGELAGLVTRHDDGLALVPGDTLVAAADRLQQDGARMPGWLGVEVQALTAPIATATGAARGVVVTWVAPQGPAAGQLAVADVIEAIDDAPVLSPAHWLARAGRLLVEEPVHLRVRRRNESREVQLTARQPPAAAAPSLGLTMRRVPQVGAEVVRVAPASAASRAGLMPGDVITLVDDYTAPTPAQVVRAFASGSEDDRPMLVAFRRGAVHHVLAVERR